MQCFKRHGLGRCAHLPRCSVPVARQRCAASAASLDDGWYYITPSFSTPMRTGVGEVDSGGARTWNVDLCLWHGSAALPALAAPEAWAGLARPSLAVLSEVIEHQVRRPSPWVAAGRDPGEDLLKGPRCQAPERSGSSHS